MRTRTARRSAARLAWRPPSRRNAKCPATVTRRRAAFDKAGNWRTFRQDNQGEDEWHLHYTSDWRLLEERLATPTPADLRRQYVWGLGINDLILRDRDTDQDGVLDERLYALQDSHWDMCAVVGADGAVVERFEYEAYGTPRVLDPAFNGRAGSVCGWSVLYSEHLFDVENREIEAYYCAGSCNEFVKCLEHALMSACGTHCKSAVEAETATPDVGNLWYSRTGRKAFCKLSREPDYPGPPSQL